MRNCPKFDVTWPRDRDEKSETDGFSARIGLPFCPRFFRFGRDQRLSAAALGRKGAERRHRGLYPLVTIDATRKQLTSVGPGATLISGEMNRFNNIPAFPSADLRGVRPNFDTLYSSGWLDLTKGPVVLSAPDTGGRYYLLPMLDMWTDVFASPGWRTTRKQAANYLLAPPCCRPDLRDKFVEEPGFPAGTQWINALLPLRAVLAERRAGLRCHLELHQPLFGEPDRLSQKDRAGALFHQPPQGHNILGHLRFHRFQVGVSNPTVPENLK